MRLKNFTLLFGAQVFKALSEETRIRILNLLYQKSEMCISDLELILGYTQAKTSRHLTYLKNSGIVFSRKVDQWVFYSIKDEVTDLMKVILDYFDTDRILNEDLEMYNSLLEKKELAKYHLMKNNQVK